MIDIMLPTYHRPDKLAEVARNIEEATMNPFTLYFGCEKDDGASIEAAKKTGHEVVVNRYDPKFGYSNTIQSIYESSSNPFLFHANDDFLFLPHWDERPIAMFDTPTVMVVGVPQSESDKSYSAVCFMRRRYIEERSGVIDMPNRVFYPYHHNYQDTEFTETAQSRGVWAACDTPCIIHQQPILMGIAEKDETYRKNDATVELDKITYNSRRHLW